MEPIKERVAVFNTSYGVRIITGEWTESMDGYTRISDYIDAEFPALPQEEIINSQITALDKEIEKVQQETIDLVNRLKQKKQELLALEHTL